jgi:flagellar biosynthesis/type III secretory pathway protein FliH
MNGRALITSRAGLALLALASAAAAAQTAPDARQTPARPEVQVTPEVAERCEREGGCALVSKRYLQHALNNAEQRGLQEGFHRGLAEGIQQGCRRKDL